MKGEKFVRMDNNKEYIIIEKHKSFENVWRCSPTYKMLRKNKSLKIDCFSTDFIKECINQKA